MTTFRKVLDTEIVTREVHATRAGFVHFFEVRRRGRRSLRRYQSLPLASWRAWAVGAVVQ